MKLDFFREYQKLNLQQTENVLVFFPSEQTVFDDDFIVAIDAMTPISMGLQHE